MRNSSSIRATISLNRGMTNVSTGLSQSVVLQLNQSLAKQHFLPKYRKIKVNEGMKLGKVEDKISYLPQVICHIFRLRENNNDGQHRKEQMHCECAKTQEGLCGLLIGWIDEEYFWKTDQQFHRIYDYYQNKKIDQKQVISLKVKLAKIEQCLGLEIGPEQRTTIMQILLNYTKHSEYYNKHQILLSTTDLQVWIGLGICYHIQLINANKQSKIIAFWALDIVMDMFCGTINCNKKDYLFGDLRTRALRNLDKYFMRWVECLSRMGIRLEEILGEWINQFMFGYMGIASIAFFMDCYRKSGPNYLIKIILSYFEYRTKEISSNNEFLEGTLSKENMYLLLINGKEEWPMIFCSASTFTIM